MSDATDQLVFPFGLGESPDDRADVQILGGKGASLAKMIRAGFPVPPGFTISAACCELVHQHAGRWPDGLEEQVRSTMHRLEQATGRTFGRGPRPLFVAVRSGAAASMPGMMDTILNCGMNPSVIDCFPAPAPFWKDYAEHIRMFAASVAGLALASSTSANNDDRRCLHSERQSYASDEQDRAHHFLKAYKESTARDFPVDPWDALIQCINAVFASWNSDRAQAYRRHHDVRGVTGTAVNVQAMFPSERSGVLFTANPNNPSAGEMIVEASWGLGEAVVSGAVTPDIYVLDTATLSTKRAIPGSRPGADPALNQEQLLELANLGRRIESHFGAASDIEWAIADGKIALLQTRQIRGLDVIEDIERGRLEEIDRLKSLAGAETIVWAVYNLAETLPAPTPLTWDLVRWFMSAQGGYGQLYGMLGQQPYEREPGCGFLELIAGRIYVDPRRAAEFHFGQLPFEYDIDEIQRDRSILERPPTRFNVDRTDSLFFFRLPGLLLKMLRGSWRMKAMAQDPSKRFDQTIVPTLDAFLAKLQRTELQRTTTTELLQELQRRRDFVLGTFAAESLVPGFFGGLAYEKLRQLLIQLFGTQEGEQYAIQLTMGLDGDVTVEQNVALFEVARRRMDREDFLDRFGHRAVNEMELSQPRWCEDHEFVDQMIDRFRDLDAPSPLTLHQRQVELRRQAELDLPARLARAGGSSLHERIELVLHQAQRLLPYREVGKYHLMRGYLTLRHVLVELGRRWDLGRDVFFLHLNELAEFETHSVAAGTRIQARKLRWRSAQKLSLADVIDSRQWQDFGRRHFVASANQHELACRPIASGTARGTARIVFEPGQVGDLGPDGILVCPSTDPGWTPLFVRAKGLIVERGGILSHGAIVARDFGIPAVVLEGATQLISDGCDIELDANQGVVVLHPQATQSQRAAARPPT